MIAPLDALAQEAAYNPQAKSELITRLTPLVNGTVNRAVRLGSTRGLIDRDDLYQQTLYYLLYLIPGYNPELGPALLYFTVRVRTKISQYIKRERRVRTLPTDILVDDLEHIAAPADQPNIGWERRTQRAFDSLTPEQRTVITLAYVHDLTDPQIAQLLNRDVPPVRQQRYRALRHMRGML